MKNRGLRAVLTRRLREYDEWEFKAWKVFAPILMDPLCTEHVGWRLKLVGKNKGVIMVIDPLKRISYRTKELIISSGALGKLKWKQLNGALRDALKE